MPSKQDLIDGILRTYNQHKFIFDKLLSEDNFYKWLNKFESFEEVRKVNRYFHGGGKIFGPNSKCLLKALKIAQEVVKRFTPDQWYRYKAISSANEHVKLLAIAIGLVKKDWIRRPKPKRRGSE